MSSESERPVGPPLSSSPVIPRLIILGARPKEATIPRGTALLHPNVPTTPQTPCTPGTPGSCPSTPGSACSDKSSLGGYSWDTAASQQILPVRCKNTTGQLYKYRFGSGGRGKCIKVGDSWYTPSEFEILGGRGGSKDWKRSIRYGGRSIQCLIEEGHLQPHATSCTCSVCCDDDSVAGPVRLFVPYKRRRGNNVTPEAENILKTSKQLFHSDSSSRSPPSSPINSKDDGRTSPLSNHDNDIEGLWSELEERVNSWIMYGQRMKRLIEKVKVESQMAKETALQQLREQMEAEKKEALEALASSTPDDVTIHEDSDKKRCGNCNREATIKCAGCSQVSYCSEFCQNKDWVLHKDECQPTDDKPKPQIIKIVIQDDSCDQPVESSQ
ncbi:Deformed epidermal autoregulatory factor 1 [Chamberlinius hualienensis]